MKVYRDNFGHPWLIVRADSLAARIVQVLPRRLGIVAENARVGQDCSTFWKITIL